MNATAALHFEKRLPDVFLTRIIILLRAKSGAKLVLLLSWALDLSDFNAPNPLRTIVRIYPTNRG